MIEQWERMMKLPIDGYISSKILGDGIYLASGMPKIFISFLSKLPVLSLMILHSSATQLKMNELTSHKNSALPYYISMTINF